MFSRRCVGLLLVILLAAGTAFGQGMLGRVVVSVTDSTGAVVVGANLELVDQATAAKRTAVSGADGKFVFLAVQNGTYKLSVNMQGFKTAVYPSIKVDLGQTAEVNAQLQVGEVKSEVVVEAAAEVLQTQTTSIEGTVQGRQLRGLPLANRDVLDFVLLMPGAQQAGGTRQSTFEGLPKGALNITMDGMNVQDNAGKSSSNGGYFTSIRPKQDAVEEISVVTANNSADAAGSGAVQIKFVTRRGTNAWHGGAFEFYRDQGFNANTFFNKHNPAAIKPRPTNHLHQYGGNIGGPLIKNKLFVFNNFEDFRLPQALSRSTLILTPLSMTGVYAYSAGQQDVMAIAAAYNAAHPAANLPTTFDPTVMAMLNKIQTVRTDNVGNPIFSAGGQPWYDTVSWNAQSGSRRYFNTTRVDWDINDKLRWNVVGQWNHFDSQPDLLNTADPAFPIPDQQKIAGGQNGRRYSLVTAFNWTITPRLNYEFRIGRTSSIVHFNDGLSLDLEYPLGYCMSFPSNMNSPYSGGAAFANLYGTAGSAGCRGLPDNRDTPVLTNSHNFGMVLGKHTLNFGGQLDVISFWEQWYNYRGRPGITLGASTYDTDVFSAFDATSLPGSTTTERATAAQFYAVLVGRVSGVSGGRNLSEITNNYQDGAPTTDRIWMKEFGIYAADSFRATKTLTINYGLRWERQGATEGRNDTYINPTYADLWGVSGVGNIFKPGTVTGNATPMLDQKSKGIFNAANGIAPSFGLAWSPNSEHKLYRALFGGPGKTVFRGGYSIAFAREGMYVPLNWIQNGPGYGQAYYLTAGREYLVPGSPVPLQMSQFNPAANSWPISYRIFPTALTLPMTMSTYTFSGNGMSTVDPNIRIPYVQSWSFGMQRELTPSMVLEARYVGNHGTRLWRGYNINEINIFENGFLNEFKQAQTNLAVCMADATCKNSPSFANQNLSNATGTQQALPILTEAFGSATSSSFRNTTYRNYVSQGQAGNLASTLAGNQTFLCNMVGNRLAACAAPPAGKTTPGVYPANFFQVNPDAAGAGVYILGNGGSSYYDALQIEVRRRMSRGLMIQGNYTFSKSLSDVYGDSTTDSSNYTTLHNTRFDRGASPFDLRHTARMFWTYELPFGPGRRWTTSVPGLNKVIEGWEFTGIFAFQSGRVFRLSSGRYTVNGMDSGVVLNGMTVKQLQEQVFITKDPAAVACAKTVYTTVYYLNPALIDPSSCTANAVSTPTSTLTFPTTPGQLGQLVYLYGPHFLKPDLTVAKQTRVTERVNFRVEARFFNAFNITNFMVGGLTTGGNTVSINSSSFGRTSTFYNDVSANQDQGPRMVEIVLRVNF